MSRPCQLWQDEIRTRLQTTEQAAHITATELERLRGENKRVLAEKVRICSMLDF
jgi:hypothetical protein